MDCFDSIGKIIKWFIKCRNKTLAETADFLGIKYKTFSEQLRNNTVNGDTLLRLSNYLNIDLNWMYLVLGYGGFVSFIEKEIFLRMQDSYRESEQNIVQNALNRILQENPVSISEARKELLKEFSHNMVYLLDSLVSEEYHIYMISQNGKVMYYVDLPRPTRGYTVNACGRRKSVDMLYKGSNVLDMIIERKKQNENFIL